VVRAFKAKFEKEYKYTSDHNGMKGYSGIYAMQAAIEKVGKVDREAVAKAMKGLKINTDKYPGALMYTEFDDKGDLDRMSFLVQVKNGKQEVIDLLPPLKTKTAVAVAKPVTDPVAAKVTKPVNPKPATVKPTAAPTTKL
jgi:branched-chain amino acid transport system substrate-binding protein